MLHIEFLDNVPSAFEKPNRRIFFSLSEKIGWDEAEALTEYAAGEM